jgi:RNA polymerase sigma-70 factor, ECF subfamily
MTASPSRALLAAIERRRKRLWALCYRMTGSRVDADDLSQEAIARAIEREDTLTDHAGLDAWLMRVATTVCLDHLRHRSVERRATELIDPLDDPELQPCRVEHDPEAAAILRDDVRFAVISALQWVPERQRAALILHDVYDLPLVDVGGMLDVNANAAKALVNRARAALQRARRRTDVDPVADRDVVERLVHAIEQRSIGAITALLHDDVWGVADAGELIPASTKPVFGARAVSRQWNNANRRLTMPLAAHLHRLNGEPAVVVTPADAVTSPLATVHVETRDGRIAALRVVRDPNKLSRLTPHHIEADWRRG